MAKRKIDIEGFISTPSAPVPVAPKTPTAQNKKGSYLRLDLVTDECDYKSYLDVMAYITHMSMTKYIQMLISNDMAANMELYETMLNDSMYVTYREITEKDRARANAKRQAKKEML